MWESRIRSSACSGLLVPNSELEQWLIGVRCIGFCLTGDEVPYKTRASDV